jgi:hypothetical protein
MTVYHNLGGVVGWWLNRRVPDCCPAVPGSNPVSPQSANLLVGATWDGTWLRADLCEVQPLVHQKHIKNKKAYQNYQFSVLVLDSVSLYKGQSLKVLRLGQCN